MKNKIIIAIFVGVIAAIILVNIVQGDSFKVENETVIEIDNRDGIQKLSDNFAQAYRNFQEAEEAHAKTQEQLDTATVEYNEAVEFLQTYTQ